MNKQMIVLLLAFLGLAACRQNTYTARTRIITSTLREYQQLVEENEQAVSRRLYDLSIDPQSKGFRWYGRAKQVKAISDQAIAYLDSLRDEILVHHQKPAVLLPTRDDRHFSVYSRLEAYKKSMIAVINPREFEENPKYYEVIEDDDGKFSKTFPLLKPRSYRSGIASLLFDVDEWNDLHFRETTGEGAVVMLDKLKNDVRLSALQLTEYFSAQVGVTSDYFYIARSLAWPAYDTIMSSQTNTIYATVGYIDHRSFRPRFYAGDSMIHPGQNGWAVYKYKAPTRPGVYSQIVRYDYFSGRHKVSGEKTVTYEVRP